MSLSFLAKKIQFRILAHKKKLPRAAKKNTTEISNLNVDTEIEQKKGGKI